MFGKYLIFERDIKFYHDLRPTSSFPKPGKQKVPRFGNDEAGQRRYSTPRIVQVFSNYYIDFVRALVQERLSPFNYIFKCQNIWSSYEYLKYIYFLIKTTLVNIGSFFFLEVLKILLIKNRSLYVFLKFRYFFPKRCEIFSESTTSGIHNSKLTQVDLHCFYVLKTSKNQ